MENCYDAEDVRLGYLRKEPNEPIDAREKILRPRTILQYHAGAIKPRGRPKPLEKQREQNCPGFPGRSYDFSSHEVPDGCDFSVATKYPYYDNQLYPKITGEKSARCSRSTSTDYDGIQAYEEEENSYKDPAAYRPNRNTSNVLTGSSAFSESEKDRKEAPIKTYNTTTLKSKTSKTGKEITKRNIKPKSQITYNARACSQEKLRDYPESWAPRNEILPESRKQFEIRRSAKQYEKQHKQNDSESCDYLHESNNPGMSYNYGASATYPAYGTNTNNVVTNFSSSTESDNDDRQTEEHTTCEEPQTYGMRKNASVCSPQQRLSKRTGLDTALKNKSEKETDSRRIKNEMEVMSRGIQNVRLQEESSDDSEDNRSYRENTDHVFKFTNSSGTDNEDRQTEHHKTYQEPSNRRNYFSIVGDSKQQQTSEKIGLDTHPRSNAETKREHWRAKEMKPRNHTYNDLNFCSLKDSLDYSNECKTASEILHDSRRLYSLGEDSRRQHSFKEVESNSTFFRKDDETFHDFSETVHDTKGGRTKCGNRNIRSQPSKWKNEKAVERSSSETRKERWSALESRHEVCLNPDPDYVPDQQRDYQVQEKELSFGWRNQDRKSFSGRNSRCAHEEYTETTPVEHGIEELSPRQKPYNRRANDSYNENEDDESEIGNSDEHSERRQQYQGIHHKNKNLRGHSSPEFYRGNHPHIGNGLHELENSKTNSVKQEIYQDVHYRSSNFERDYPQGYFAYKDDSYDRSLPNSNQQGLLKDSYMDGSDYNRRELVGMSSSNENVKQQYDKEGKSVSRSVREAEHDNLYQSYASLGSPNNAEDQASLPNKNDSYGHFLPNSNPHTLVKDTYRDENDYCRMKHADMSSSSRNVNQQYEKERKSASRSVRGAERVYDNPYQSYTPLGSPDADIEQINVLPSEDDSYTHFLPNPNPHTLVKDIYRDGSDHYRAEHAGMSSSSRIVNQQYDKEGRSVLRLVRGEEYVHHNLYQSYDSMRSPNHQEEKISSLSLDQRSNDSPSVHESNMRAVKDTVIADLNAFGSKLNEAILSCHVSLQLFKVAYEEWIKVRDATLRMSRALEAEIRGNGDWKAGFTGFCDFLKTAGGVAEQILRFTPYGGIAAPMIRVVPPVIEKVGNAIIGLTNRNKTKDPELPDMLQVLQTDVEESSQLKMFALQCEMQFKETEELLIEFLDVLYSQQMADAIEDMGLLSFIIDLSDANPTSDSFFRGVSDAYRKFYYTGKEEPTATWEAFCSFIDRDPSVLETLQCINWQFTKSFQNDSAEKDLSMCWTAISTLVNSSNDKEAEGALSRIANIVRILETQRNFVSTNVSKLFKVS